MRGWDRHLEHRLVAHRVSFLDPVFRWLTHVGDDGLIWLAIALGVALASRRWGVLAWVLAADVAAQLSTSLVKLVVPRQRPHVHTLVREPHTHSFPSGHAASSFACAVVVSAYAPRWRVPLFVLAALIAFSRCYVGVHYPLDVLAGSLAGVGLGYGVLATARSRSWSGSRAAP